MARLVGLLGLVVLIVAVPATHDILAAPPAKVSICHVNSSNSPGTWDYEYGYTEDYTALPPLPEDYYDLYDYAYVYQATYTHHLGRVIEVAEDAVAAHVAHGDSTTFAELTDSFADYITSLEDLDFSHSYTSTWTYTDFEIVYEEVESRVGTNGVVKNANCTWTTSEYSYSN